MKLKWGTFEHPNCSVQFTFQKHAIMSPSFRRLGYKIRVSIRGAVFAAANQAAVTTAIQSLETAYASDGQDLVFVDDADVATPHSIISANTINGTRVIQGPTWAPGWKGVWGAGLEYFNRRTFRVVVEAEVSDPEGSEDIVSYRETSVLISEGDPDFVIQEALSGAPQKQNTAQATKQIARQFGTAVGYLDYPDFPSALWDTAHQKPVRHKGFMSPERFGANLDTHFPIHWDYRFEAASGLSESQPSPPI